MGAHVVIVDRAKKGIGDLDDDVVCSQLSRSSNHCPALPLLITDGLASGKDGAERVADKKEGRRADGCGGGESHVEYAAVAVSVLSFVVVFELNYCYVEYDRKAYFMNPT